MKAGISLAVSTAVLLAAQLIQCMNASASAAADELTDGIFTYELVGESYTITGTAGTTIFDEIPAMRNGYAVTAIAPKALADCTFISELKIPDTIKTIGEYAFAGCTSLKTLTISENLKDISTGAFAGCSALTDVVIPEKTETIGDRAFYGCSALESVEFSETLTSIGDYSFQACYSLKEIELPASLNSLGEMAFGDCASLEGITADGSSAFVVEDDILYNSDKSTIYRAVPAKIKDSLYIADSVKEIGGGAFSYCTEIKSLFVPSSVQKIGGYAFNFCTGLQNVDLSEGVSELGAFSFASCTALETAALPITMKTVGEAAFIDNAALTRVTIPDGVTTIDTGAFLACPKLKNVSVPASVENIGEYSFGYTAGGGDSKYVRMDGFSMSVNSGSAAEKYARSNDLDCNVVDRSLKKFAFVVIAVALVIAAVIFALVLMHRGRKLAPSDVRKAEAEEKENQDYDGIL